ncbi:MAG: CehA/McbA family metallohydrolase [Sandaracinaceae bacterium]|nr:CehA/McbA family metallohydrolase [Sandaracinaceae bacterium]MBK7150578.1 CehA/McbA family metallohydrolase [Sandaracinaceae bacterium]MBP7683598.1 CehA/McbA family metallohydrolase [Deltaproteobacteria bacterium]
MNLSTAHLAMLVSLVAAGCGDAPVGPPAPTGEWLRGDLHLHSSHSTDALDNPVDVVIARAEGLGMDYFVFTDHDNHVNGAITTWSDPLYASDQMVMLYGTEFTTARFHANLFSAMPWDHLALYALRDGAGEDILDEAHAQGLHFSVNHPVNMDPWELPLSLPYDSMEVWNAVFRLPANNTQAIALWDGLLLDGRRVPARGGSDSHHQEGYEGGLLNVGNPTTWIFARERTAEAIIEALGAGRASISYAAEAERLDFSADAEGDGVYETLVGDTLPAAGRRLRFRVEVASAQADAEYELTVLRNGEPFITQELTATSFEFEDRTDAGSRVYYRAELRGPVNLTDTTAPTLYGNMIAMTNPIYVGYE